MHRLIRWSSCRLAFLNGRAFTFLSVLFLSGLFFSGAGAQAFAQQDSIRFDPNNCQGALYTEEDVRNFRRNFLTKYRSALKTANLRSDDKARLDGGAKYFVYRMTMPENKEQLPKLIDEIIREIEFFARPVAQPYLLDRINVEARRLLTQCDLVVRLNGVVLLERLNERKADLVRGIPALPYAEVAPALLDVLSDPNQEPAMKQMATRALDRILRFGKLKGDQRDLILRGLVAALNWSMDPANQPVSRKQSEAWWAYQRRIVDALGEIGTEYTLNLEPLGVEALFKVLKDSEAHYGVRSRAARALSKIPYSDSAFDVEALVGHTLMLLSEMIPEYNQNPTTVFWRAAMFDIYLSFKPPTKKQADNGIGWLAISEKPAYRKSGPMVGSAFDSVLPIISQISPNPPLAMRPLPRNSMTKLNEWLQTNPPGPTPHPKIAPILSKEPAVPDVVEEKSTAATLPTSR